MSTEATTQDPASTPERAEASPEVQEAFDRVFGDGDEPTSQSRPSSVSAEDHDDPESTASLERAGEEDLDPSLLDRDDAGDEGEELDESADDGAGGQDTRDGDGGEPTLDPVLRHAARRAGWKDAEIDELAATKPELAVQTFQRLHSSYSDLSARYAQIGQKAIGDQQQGGSQSQAPDGRGQREPSPPQQSDDPVELIFGKESKKLADKYGDDFISDVVKPMASKLMGMIQPVHQDYQQRQQEQIGRQVNSFFDGLPEAHKELYGASGKVSDEQGARRQEVAQVADQILAGAEAQGVPMSIDEALDRAVAVNAQQHLATLERKRIQSQVKKRSNRLTARPSHRRSESGGSRKAAEQSVAAKMAEIGMD